MKLFILYEEKIEPKTIFLIESGNILCMHKIYGSNKLHKALWVRKYARAKDKNDSRKACTACTHKLNVIQWQMESYGYVRNAMKFY